MLRDGTLNLLSPPSNLSVETLSHKNIGSENAAIQPMNNKTTERLSSLKIRSCTKNDSAVNCEKHTHCAVNVDPLYSDPRRPEAKVFACKCGINYFSSKALALHVITMKFGNVYTCKLCLQGFRYLHSLKKHVKGFHKETFKTFLCAFCRKHFKSHRAFTKHLFEKHEG